MAKCIIGEQARRNDIRKKTRKRISEFIIGRMRLKKITQGQLGEALGMTQQAFGQRLKTGLFEADELPVLWEILGVEDDEILRILK